MGKAKKTLGVKLAIWAGGFIAVCLLFGAVYVVVDYIESHQDPSGNWEAVFERLQKYQDFRNAWKGQIWIIDDCDIPLLEEPCPGMLRDSLLNYLSKDKIKCLIRSGSKVEIIAMKSRGWKYVKVIPENDMGWINGRMIKEAYKEEK